MSTAYGVRPTGVVLPWAMAPVPWPSTPGPSSSERTSELPRPSVSDALAAPAVPDADRAEVGEATMLSAAVLLDVLATATRRLEGQPAVLADVAQVAVDVGRHGAADAEARLEALVALAAGAAGARRAELATTLAAALGREGDGADREPTHATVAAALRHIEAATRLAVREARAVLEARTTPEVHQA